MKTSKNEGKSVEKSKKRVYIGIFSYFCVLFNIKVDK